MSTLKGRYLAWYLGTSLVGVSEQDSNQHAALVFWAGTWWLSRQLDGHARRPREDLTEGRAVLSAHPVAADCGPGGDCCTPCFLPCLSLGTGSLLISRLGLERPYKSVFSLTVTLSVCDGQRCK